MNAATRENRIVVKIGTSSLVTGGRLDPAKIGSLADAVAELLGEGYQPLLVASGAIALGNSQLTRADLTRSDPARSGLPRSRLSGPAARQVAAAVGQGWLFEALRLALERRGVLAAQFLLTPLDVVGEPHRDSVHEALDQVLSQGIVPVVNENDAIAVRNNDILAALLSGLLRARMLVLLTDVAGLYAGDPRSDPAATHIPEVAAMCPDLERLAGGAMHELGTGGMATKLCAVWIATFAGVLAVIASAAEPDAPIRAVRGESVGTVVRPRSPDGDLDLGRLWRAFSSNPRGRLLCDGTAEQAVLAGACIRTDQILGVAGDFGAGEVVDVVRPDSVVIARGRARVDAKSLGGVSEVGPASAPGWQGRGGRRTGFVRRPTAERSQAGCGESEPGSHF